MHSQPGAATTENDAVGHMTSYEAVAPTIILPADETSADDRIPPAATRGCI